MPDNSSSIINKLSKMKMKKGEKIAKLDAHS